ncbi:unnamed protein product [Rhizophagus irregularis]|nr:unnamed protein product [Rhizophagus irregularis]
MPQRTRASVVFNHHLRLFPGFLQIVFVILLLLLNLYNSYSLRKHQDETKSDSVEIFWKEQTELQRIRTLELQGVGDMLKLGNDQSAVDS